MSESTPKLAGYDTHAAEDLLGAGPPLGASHAAARVRAHA
jgi:hypothetical protein